MMLTAAHCAARRTAFFDEALSSGEEKTEEEDRISSSKFEDEQNESTYSFESEVDDDYLDSDDFDEDFL